MEQHSEDDNLLELLRDAEEFVDRHSELWYTSGQDLLRRIRHKVTELENGE